MLYQNGSEVVSLKFNATGTNNLDWFSQERLISSPWNDLKTVAQLRKFGIVGLYSRFFEISLSYNACDYDNGWLLIVGTGCIWERRVPSPSIQFSKLSNAVTWGEYGMCEARHFESTYIKT